MAGVQKLLIAGVALAGMSLGLATAASADCVNKAASGTAPSVDGAKFQAWEAVLQATDWGSWASFMGSGKGPGSAPGYKVSNVRSSCSKGGLGYSCKMQATLCK